MDWWLHVRRRQWWIVVCLVTFLTVQWSPYLAMASIPHAAPPSSPQTAIPLLAQLQAVPDRTVSLANFTPEVSGFQFSNQELIEAIDLDKNAQDWEEVLTEQLEQMFGTQVCIGQEISACVLTSAAQDWLKTQLDRMDLGVAEGMATAALALWDPEPPRQIPWWQRLINFLLGRTVFGLARSLFELQTFIANFFLMQTVDEVFQPTQVIRDTLTPTQILLTVLEVFLTGSLDPFTMGVYRVLEDGLTEGHALTPYSIEDRGNGKYWVYVYDSNYPAERSVPLDDLHVEFDTVQDTWTYQPTPKDPVFKGNAQSKTLDLSHLSWRQPPESHGPLADQGPFTCPFCNRPIPRDGGDTAPSSEPSTATLTLIGEGQMTVTPLTPSEENRTDTTVTAPRDQMVRVPFRGGLYRHVPASYAISPENLNQPLQITLKGKPLSSSNPATLQLTGPGYTADFEDLVLSPEEQLTLYVIPQATGPELTFLANQPTEIPHLSIHLTDDTRAYQFDSSTPEGFSQTERQVAKSAGFELWGLKLPTGKRVAMATQGGLKRFYFADDDGQDSQYQLTVKNRMVIRDRIQIGETNPDFLNYTLTYEEELQANNLQVDARTQAFFDYDPAFVDPADRPRQELIAAFEQRDFPITLTYEPLSAVPDRAGPLGLRPSPESPLGRRVFRASLRKADAKAGKP